MSKQTTAGVPGKVRLLLGFLIAGLAAYFSTISHPEALQNQLALPVFKDVLINLGFFFIPFAMIRINGESVGTVSREDGSFLLKIPDAYLDQDLLISCLGYEPLELLVSKLKPGVGNVIKLQPSVKDLGEVTVVQDKSKSALKILKKAISKIPDNYPERGFTFDAYYRERIMENQTTIKFADAAVTFQQGGYTGKVAKSGASFQLLESIGHNENGLFSGEVSVFCY